MVLLTKNENRWTFAQSPLKLNRMIWKVAQDVDVAPSMLHCSEKKEEKEGENTIFATLGFCYVNDPFGEYC